MADKKEYSAGGAKKWLVIVGVVVLIGIIITAIVLSIPANTYSMVTALQTNQQNFFLNDKTDEQNYDSFASKISSNGTISYYSQEVGDVKVLTQSMEVVLDFYNNYMAFAKNNDTLKDNYKTIKNNLQGAIKNQNDMNEIIENSLKLTEVSGSYLQNAWIDFRKEYYQFLNNYQVAFNSLSQCYEKCFGQSLSNNIASKTILNTVNDYMDVFAKDIKVLISTNSKGDVSQSSYSYKSHGKVVDFSNFVSTYIARNSQMTSYMFDETLQVKYEKINQFFSLYGEKNFFNVIDSISNDKYQVTKTYENVVDENGVYSLVKQFITLKEGL